MKTSGTIKEWLALGKSDFMLTNPRFMNPKLYAIQFVRKLPKRIEVSGLTFQSRDFDFQSFNGCGYVRNPGERDSVQYLCALVTVAGGYGEGGESAGVYEGVSIDEQRL